jgi:hypothetical protein
MWFPNDVDRVSSLAVSVTLRDTHASDPQSVHDVDEDWTAVMMLVSPFSFGTTATIIVIIIMDQHAENTHTLPRRLSPHTTYYSLENPHYYPILS